MSHQMETRCVHGDSHKYHEDSRAISFPIYQTASFGPTELGHNGSGFDYTRESNPTREHLEETMATLESAVDVVAFTSGIAAISACFELFRPGDHIICSEDLYGGTVRLLRNIEEKNGLNVIFAMKRISAEGYNKISTVLSYAGGFLMKAICQAEAAEGSGSQPRA